jgi:uncharacterized cysteine cluster protein YcgN (CxxCxxCC family)
MVEMKCNVCDADSSFPHRFFYFFSGACVCNLCLDWLRRRTTPILSEKYEKLCKKCGKCCIIDGIRCRYLLKNNTCSVYDMRMNVITHIIGEKMFICSIRNSEFRHIDGCGYNGKKENKKSKIQKKQ